MTINERVAKGAAILDAKKPGWERQIDIASLQLADSCHCVLGQLYGHYFDGLDAIKLLHDPALIPGTSGAGAGFNTYPHEGMTVFADLDEAWISLVKERFDTGAFSDSV